MKRTSILSICLLFVILLVYFLGPKPGKPIFNLVIPSVPEINFLESYIQKSEKRHTIKAGNEAKIIWFDTLQSQTDYALVYLHGFSASHEEGNPLHLQSAKKLKANLYLSRLADHGIDTVDQMLQFSPDRLWESGKKALAIGKKLGKKVVLMGTSNGAALALQLAAMYPDQVYALILLSPNIEINEKGVFLLNNPWGLQLARAIVGQDFRELVGKSKTYTQYWYTKYRLESVVAVQHFVEHTMTKETFSKVKQPVLMLYYYKNDKQQDKVVKVEPMLRMFEELGTTKNLKFKKAIPEAGNHVLSSYVTSKDLVTPQEEIDKFIGFLNTEIK